MGNPVFGATKVDKLLTDFSVAYRNENYISERLLPVMKVKERSGKFAKYGKDNMRVHTNIQRAPGTRASSFDYTVSQGTYACAEHALEKKVPDEVLNNQDDPYDALRDASMFLVDAIWLNQEAALAADMANTAILTLNTTLSGTDQWNDTSNQSDPIGDFLTARKAIKEATGKNPNVAAFGYQAWIELIYHADIVDRVKFIGMTDPMAIKKAVAQLLEVDEVLVGDAIKMTSNEGQTDDTDYVWGKHAWLLHRAARPGLMMPSFGYTMKDVNREVDRYREESVLAEFVRVRDSFDQTIVDANLAYLIKNAVA